MSEDTKEYIAMTDEDITPHELTNRQIAQVAHETNRAFCKATDQGPEYDTGSWEGLYADTKQSLVDAVGKTRSVIHSGGDTSPVASHNRWLEAKRADGWTFGPFKDEAKKKHPCMQDYLQLPLEQQMKDKLFVAIVRELASLGHDY